LLVDPGSAGIAKVGRYLLWLALLGTSFALLNFSVQMSYGYSPVQSLDVVSTSPVGFSIVYYSWLSLLFWLLVTHRRDGSHYEYPALAALFSTVFLGFWSFLSLTSYPPVDGLFSAATVKQIVDEGKIADSGSANLYSSFPGLHIATAILSKVTDSEVLPSVRVMTAFLIVAIPVASYVLLYHAVTDGFLAALGTILLVQGNPYSTWSTQFYPGNFSLLFFLLLISSQFSIHDRVLVRRPVEVLLLGASVPTHLVTTLAASTSVLGGSLASPKNSMPRIGLVLPAFVLTLAWLLFWARGILERVFAVVDSALRGGGGHFTYLRLIWRTRFGAAMPWWVSAVDVYWLFLTFVVGGVLAIAGFVQGADRVSSQLKYAQGGLAGIILLATILTMAGAGGSQYFRFLMYGGVFTVLILICRIRQSRPRARAFALVALVCSLYLLSLPTFIAYNPNVRLYSYYNDELATGTFLERMYGTGRSLEVYQEGGGWVTYHLRYAKWNREGEAWQLGTKEGAWANLDGLVANFSQRTVNEKRLWIFSPRLAGNFEYLYGIHSDDTRWDSFKSELARTDRIYDAGRIQTFWVE
jgi:hypothetical protein